ncbi:nucleotide-diphospho-sugar transferase [Gammaproteobacteria bacterium]|nr:nucleotide-diphospho-sugar transferase [Gammaproteobacteria bacterium]
MKDFIQPAPLKTPVLFLVFNRINVTKQVFESIKKARPPKLYIASDGPRDGYENEAEKVREIRDFIIINIDWECEVKTLFRDNNLGCKLAVSGAITWFFEHEEQGIILEDDCLPSQSFFWFCEDLLNKYKYDKRIFQITGYNKQNKWQKSHESYFFSMLGGIWGWASWSRAWDHYDIEMSDVNQFIENDHFENLFGKNLGKQRQDMIYRNIIKNKMNTWDYQWAYARHKNSGMTCVPCNNLIENIGFGEDATHTIGVTEDNVQKQEIKFPLKSNNFIVADRVYDNLFMSRISFFEKFLKKLKSILDK